MFLDTIGRKYDGAWLNGKRNGVGEYTEKDGTKKRAIFSDDKVV